MSEKDKGRWEKKTPEEQRKANYRFGGSRYSLKSRDFDAGTDYIPQINGLYPFPKGDIEDPISN